MNGSSIYEGPSLYHRLRVILRSVRWIQRVLTLGSYIPLTPKIHLAENFQSLCPLSDPHNQRPCCSAGFMQIVERYGE